MLLKNFQTMFVNYVGAYSKTMNNGDTQPVPSFYFGYFYPSCHYGDGSSTGAFHVVVGTGNTDPTINDYDLADASIMASDKLRPIKQMVTNSKSDGTVISTQYQNESNTAITVKEIGIAYKNGYSAYDKGSNILVARKVLSTPVTIQPGEVYIFSYNIKV